MISILVILCAVAFALIGGLLYRNHQLSARTITCSAVAVALSVILSTITLFSMPQGGSVTPCSMMFICFVGYWFGPAAGILAGVANGLIQLIINPEVYHPIQVILDYPLAFGALGLAGLFTKSKYSLQIGFVVGMLSRFIFSFVSGYIFFSDTGANVIANVITSAVYNLSYILPELIISLIIVSIPVVRHAIDLIVTFQKQPA
jgi:thiamine transporter